MSGLAAIYKILGLVICAIGFSFLIFIILKIQAYQEKAEKAEMDLKDELIRSKINSESLSDVVDDNNKSRKS